MRFYHWNAALMRQKTAALQNRRAREKTAKIIAKRTSGWATHHAQHNCYIWTYFHLVSYDFGSIFFKDASQIPTQFGSPIGHVWLLYTYVGFVWIFVFN